MKVQPADQGPLHALNSLLQSVESVRNTRALFLLLLSFATSGLIVTMLQRALASESVPAAVFWGGAAFLIVLYGSNAAGLVLMDEACRRPLRDPVDALRDAVGCAHRLLVVVVCVLLLAAGVLAVLLGLVAAAQLPVVGPTWLGLVVPVVVPVVGLLVLTLVGLVGPVAAPAIWFGLSPRAVLGLLLRQARQRFAHVVVLAAAVSLLSAGVAGLVSFVVLSGARALVAMTLLMPTIDLQAQPFMAALFGVGLRQVVGAPALSAYTTSALHGAGVVFALGLVLPAVVYLRGLCELFLAVRRNDMASNGDTGTADDDGAPPALPALPASGA